MGTWIGHVAPAIFFICISTWWAIVTSYRYIKSKRCTNKSTNDHSYRGSLTMPCSCCKCGRNVPIESFIKFIGLFTEVIGEIIMGMKFTREVELHEMHSGMHHESADSSFNASIVQEHKQIEKHFYIHEESLHHVMMFGGFLLASFVELLIYFGVSFPKKTAYVINLVSVFIMVATIILHLDGRDMIDKQLHMLFGVATVCLAISYCLETYNPGKI